MEQLIAKRMWRSGVDPEVLAKKAQPPLLRPSIAFEPLLKGLIEFFAGLALNCHGHLTGRGPDCTPEVVLRGGLRSIEGNKMLHEADK